MEDRELHDVDEQPDLEPGSKPPSIPWGPVFLFIWAVAIFIFAVQNAEDVTVEFTWIQLTMPLAVLVVGTALATALLTSLAWAVHRRRRRKRG